MWRFSEGFRREKSRAVRNQEDCNSELLRCTYPTELLHTVVDLDLQRRIRGDVQVEQFVVERQFAVLVFPGHYLVVLVLVNGRSASGLHGEQANRSTGLRSDVVEAKWSR